MKKPSLKNKLTADKIEEANRLLSAQSSVSQNIPKKNIDTDERVSRLDALRQGVAHVQNVETAKPITKGKTVKKPEAPQSKPKQASQKTFIAEPQPMRLVRVTVDVPEDLHEKLKIKMILSKQTIKDYLLNFIEKDLAKSNFKF